MADRYKKIMRNGIWDNNIVLTQSLALCPALAVTSTATNGIGMGLATTAVLIASNFIVSVSRGIITPEVRIPVFVLLFASIVTLVDMFMNAYLHELYKVLGLFISLIVTNCALLGRAEAFAFRQPVADSVLDGLMTGLGFTLALVMLAGVREIFGSGTLFADASLMFGEAFKVIEVTIIPEYSGFLLMILPPGGFIAMGFILAGKRVIDAGTVRQDPAHLPVLNDGTAISTVN